MIKAEREVETQVPDNTLLPVEREGEPNMRGVCQRLSCSGSHIPDRKDGMEIVIIQLLGG